MATDMEHEDCLDGNDEAAHVSGHTNTYLELSQKLAALSCTGQLNVKRPGAVNANWLRTEGLSTPTLVKSDGWKDAPQMGVTMTHDILMRYPLITIDLMLDLLLRSRRGLRLEVDTWDAVRQEPGPRWTLMQWQAYWRGHQAARQQPAALQQDLDHQHARWLADQSKLGLMEAAAQQGPRTGKEKKEEQTPDEQEAAQQRWLKGPGPVKAASAMDVGVRAKLLEAQAAEQGVAVEAIRNAIDEAAAADVAAAWAEVAEDADNDYVFRSPDDDHTLVTLDSSDADNAEGQSTLPRVHISPGQTGRLLEAAWIPLESGKPLFTGDGAQEGQARGGGGGGYGENESITLMPPAVFHMTDGSTIDKAWEEFGPGVACPNAKSLLHLQLAPKGSYRDFHVAPGGGAVWCHVLSGCHTFVLLPPSPSNLALYMTWYGRARGPWCCLAEHGEGAVKGQVRPGQSLFIPCGWVYSAVADEDTVSVGTLFWNPNDIPAMLQAQAIQAHFHLRTRLERPIKGLMWALAAHYAKLLMGKAAEGAGLGLGLAGGGGGPGGLGGAAAGGLGGTQHWRIFEMFPWNSKAAPGAPQGNATPSSPGAAMGGGGGDGPQASTTTSSSSRHGRPHKYDPKTPSPHVGPQQHLGPGLPNWDLNSNVPAAAAAEGQGESLPSQLPHPRAAVHAFDRSSVAPQEVPAARGTRPHQPLHVHTKRESSTGGGGPGSLLSPAAQQHSGRTPPPGSMVDPAAAAEAAGRLTPAAMGSTPTTPRGVTTSGGKIRFKIKAGSNATTPRSAAPPDPSFAPGRGVTPRVTSGVTPMDLGDEDLEDQDVVLPAAMKPYLLPEEPDLEGAAAAAGGGGRRLRKRRHSEDTGGGPVSSAAPAAAAAAGGDSNSMATPPHASSAAQCWQQQQQYEELQAQSVRVPQAAVAAAVAAAGAVGGRPPLVPSAKKARPSEGGGPLRPSPGPPGIPSAAGAAAGLEGPSVGPGAGGSSPEEEGVSRGSVPQPPRPHQPQPQQQGAAAAAAAAPHSSKKIKLSFKKTPPLGGTPAPAGLQLPDMALPAAVVPGVLAGGAPLAAAAAAALAGPTAAVVEQQQQQQQPDPMVQAGAEARRPGSAAGGGPAAAEAQAGEAPASALLHASSSSIPQVDGAGDAGVRLSAAAAIAAAAAAGRGWGVPCRPGQQAGWAPAAAAAAAAAAAGTGRDDVGRHGPTAAAGGERTEQAGQGVAAWCQQQQRRRGLLSHGVSAARPSIRQAQQHRQQQLEHMQVGHPTAAAGAGSRGVGPRAAPEFMGSSSSGSGSRASGSRGGLRIPQVDGAGDAAGVLVDSHQQLTPQRLQAGQQPAQPQQQAVGQCAPPAPAPAAAAAAAATDGSGAPVSPVPSAAAAAAAGQENPAGPSDPAAVGRAATGGAATGRVAAGVGGVAAALAAAGAGSAAPAAAAGFERLLPPPESPRIRPDAAPLVNPHFAVVNAADSAGNHAGRSATPPLLQLGQPAVHSAVNHVRGGAGAALAAAAVAGKGAKAGGGGMDSMPPPVLPNLSYLEHQAMPTLVAELTRQLVEGERLDPQVAEMLADRPLLLLHHPKALLKELSEAAQKAWATRVKDQQEKLERQQQQQLAAAAAAAAAQDEPQQLVQLAHKPHPRGLPPGAQHTNEAQHPPHPQQPQRPQHAQHTPGHHPLPAAGGASRREEEVGVWGPYPPAAPLATCELSEEDLNDARFAKLRACIQQREALGPQVVPWASAGPPEAAGAGADWQPLEALPAGAAAALQGGGPALPASGRALAAALAAAQPQRPAGGAGGSQGASGGAQVPYHHFAGRKQQQALGLAQDYWLWQQRRQRTGAGGGQVPGGAAGGVGAQQQGITGGQLQVGWSNLGVVQQGQVEGVVDAEAAAAAAEQGPQPVVGVVDDGSQVTGGWYDPSEKVVAWVNEGAQAASQPPSVAETADSGAGTSAAGGAVANAGGGRATGVSKRRAVGEVPGGPAGVVVGVLGGAAAGGPVTEVGRVGGAAGGSMRAAGGYVEGKALAAAPAAGAGAGLTPKRAAGGPGARTGQAMSAADKQAKQKQKQQRKGLGLLGGK